MHYMFPNQPDFPASGEQITPPSQYVYAASLLQEMRAGLSQTPATANRPKYLMGPEQLIGLIEFELALRRDADMPFDKVRISLPGMPEYAKMIEDILLSAEEPREAQVITQYTMQNAYQWDLSVTLYTTPIPGLALETKVIPPHVSVQGAHGERTVYTLVGEQAALEDMQQSSQCLE
jgi:hypothetical protein